MNTSPDQPAPELPEKKAAALRPRRLGGLEGLGDVPDDFDTMFAEEILTLFEGRGE